MDCNLKVNMNEYLPLRDVVFNTLRQAILMRRIKTRGETDGDPAGRASWGKPYTNP